jgi:hypothetical protein
MITSFSEKIITSLILAATLLIIPFLALAQTGTYNFNDQSGLSSTAAGAGYDISSSATSIEAIIGSVILSVISLVGVLFLVLVIAGAYTWMTARDNAEKVKKATNTITNALIGLVITLAAYAIAYFLINKFW